MKSKFTMKTTYLNTKVFSKIKLYVTGIVCLFWMTAALPVSGQSVLFDFDNAPIYTSLPINLTAGGITAHFAATGQGFSIQDANVLGFTPAGFSGNVIYPNSVYYADLLIGFDQTLTHFSIMYSCQELGCDDAALMRVTAFMNGAYVGTSTMTATFPGTWPVDTLACTFSQGFDSVVVHYDSPPPTCQDYGVIFMADNMWVTPMPTGISTTQQIIDGLIIPNPISQQALITFNLAQIEAITITVCDISGKVMQVLYSGKMEAGANQLTWNINKSTISSGEYVLNFSGQNFSKSVRVTVVK